jgi:hypothetical protein
MMGGRKEMGNGDVMIWDCSGVLFSKWGRTIMTRHFGMQGRD